MTAASKSEVAIRQGQTLLSVQLAPQAVVHVKAACDNWRLPTPDLKPALSQIHGEGNIGAGINLSARVEDQPSPRRCRDGGERDAFPALHELLQA